MGGQERREKGMRGRGRKKKLVSSIKIFQVCRTSLVVQWLRLYAPNARGWGSILGRGTRSHMPQ